MQDVSDGGDGVDDDDGGDGDGDDGNDAGDNGNDNDDDDKKSASWVGYGAGSTYIRIFTVGRCRCSAKFDVNEKRVCGKMTPHPFQLRCGCYTKKKEREY